MNAADPCLGLVLVALFLALFVQLNHLQVVEAKALAEHPGQHPIALRDFGEAAGIDHHRRRSSSLPARSPTLTARARSRSSASTREARCTDTSRATSPSPSAAVGVEKRFNDDAGRTTPWPLSAIAIRDLLDDRTVRRTWSSRSTTRCNVSPRNRSASARARSWRSTPAPARSSPWCRTRRTTRLRSPPSTSTTSALRGRR